MTKTRLVAILLATCGACGNGDPKPAPATAPPAALPIAVAFEPCNGVLGISASIGSGAFADIATGSGGDIGDAFNSDAVGAGKIGGTIGIGAGSAHPKSAGSGARYKLRDTPDVPVRTKLSGPPSPLEQVTGPIRECVRAASKSSGHVTIELAFDAQTGTVTRAAVLGPREEIFDACLEAAAKTLPPTVPPSLGGLCRINIGTDVRALGGGGSAQRM